jgi:hypothetical protein
MGPVGHRGKSGRREFSTEPPSAIVDKLPISSWTLNMR